jgi:large subunit ribosomal protein L17
MRHNNKINHLGRTYSHRAAMLSNMAISLITHKRIFTTLAKAKELRKYVEPMISKSKNDTTHSRRLVFAELQDKYAVTELFKDIAQKIGERPGGYTRIIKTGNRLGDNASMCFIELVDYNELMLKDTKKAATKTRRSRRGSGASAEAKETTAVEVVAGEVKAPKTEKAEKPAAPKAKAPKKEKVAEPVVEETVAVEETAAVVEETPAATEEVATEATATETPAEEAPAAE